MAWGIDFVRQSTILCELRTKPTLDVVLSRDALRAAVSSSMIRSSDFRDPFEITSKKTFTISEKLDSNGAFEYSRQLLRKRDSDIRHIAESDDLGCNGSACDAPGLVCVV